MTQQKDMVERQGTGHEEKSAERTHSVTRACEPSQ